MTKRSGKTSMICAQTSKCDSVSVDFFADDNHDLSVKFLTVSIFQMAYNFVANPHGFSKSSGSGQIRSLHHRGTIYTTTYKLQMHRFGTTTRRVFLTTPIIFSI